MLSSAEVAGARARRRPLALAAAVPAWAWLAGLVAVSTAVRFAFARRVVAPWIFADELIYSELAKSLAATGELLIRGEPAVGSYGVVYPLLLSPAFAFFESVPDAYTAAKATNAIVVSLAAVPAYFLARRVVSQPLALVVAGTTVLVPGVLYAGTLMTENAFYPLFLTAALALVLALERPTALRVLALLGVTALAFLTRAQAVVLLPAMWTAPLLLGSVRRHRLLYLVPAAIGALAVAAQWARGRSPAELVGAYRAALETDYDVGEALRWLLYHVAELDLAVGVVPFAALLLLATLGRRLDPRERAFLAAALALVAWMLVQVAVFASRHSLRIEERNLFCVTPLFLVALLLWVQRGAPRPAGRTAVCAVVAALLPLAIPFERLVNVSATSDTFGLLPWWRVHELGVALGLLWLPVLGLAALLALAFALVPSSAALALPLVVALFFAGSWQPVEERIRDASVGALFQGITVPERDWVDRAAGRDAEVAAVWTGRLDWFTIAENEFFSRSIGPVYWTEREVPDSGLAQSPLLVDPATGRLRSEGNSVEAEYVLVDESLSVAGVEVARDARMGLRLLRVGGPLGVEHTTSGLYGDGWSGPTVTYTRYGCDGGTLAVELAQDPNLFLRPQTVRAAGRSWTVSGSRTIAVPLKPRDGRCVARFSVAPTGIPAELRPGSDDTRRLGLRFERFRYQP